MEDRRTALLTFLNIGHAIDHMAVLIFPTAVLGMSADLGLGYAELLPLSLGGFITFGLFSLPAGWLGDRWSRRHMMAVFFFGIGAALMTVGLMTGPLGIAFGLGIVGAFAAIYHPVANALLVADQARLGRVLGVNGLFGNLGVAFAALITGALVDHAGWRAAFFVPGALSIALGIAYLLLVPRVLPSGRKAGAAIVVDRPTRARLFAVLMVATICGGVVFNATTVSMPKVFAERLGPIATSATDIGTLVCLVYVLAALAQLCVGPLIDRMSMRRIFIPVAALQVPLLAIAAYADGWAMLVAAILMMFFVFGQIPINDAMVGRYTAEAYRSRVFAVRYVASFAASATAVPLIAGLYSNTGDFKVLFLVLAVLSGLTTLGALAFPGARRLARGQAAMAPAE